VWRFLSIELPRHLNLRHSVTDIVIIIIVIVIIIISTLPAQASQWATSVGLSSGDR
jgi:hypothetical protein